MKRLILAFVLVSVAAPSVTLADKSASKDAAKPAAMDSKKDSAEADKKEMATGFDHDHKVWTEVLKNFVIVNGAASKVNYKALKASPDQLNQYLTTLSGVSSADYKAYSDKQKIAFLINAYNAFTLKLIIKNYPVKSIKDIGGLFSSPWKKEFFKLFGKDMYLDKIEHKILRKKFNEPRIHFAVNCASIGCPALRGEAFTAEKLDDQLNEQAKLFLMDKSRNSFDQKKKELTLSKIFKWFDDDFEKNGSTVPKFVARYMTEDEALQKEIANYKVDDYSDYDWGLNEVK